jgi:hypothetical protein
MSLVSKIVTFVAASLMHPLPLPIPLPPGVTVSRPGLASPPPSRALGSLHCLLGGGGGAGCDGSTQ